MKFEKGQWVTCEGFYMQIMNRVSDHVYECRFAGRKGEWVDEHIGKMIPASLTPDFSNAKVGDECFDSRHGNVKIEFLFGFTRDGKLSNSDTHPTLFNSFAQFLAYWQEEALKLKGDSDA